MNKISCGGFKLDNNFLGMNENDELSLVVGGEGKAYQQLVTNGNGNVKWEDRLAYKGVALTEKFAQTSVAFTTVPAGGGTIESQKSISLNYFNNSVSELVCTLDGVDYHLEKHYADKSFYGNAYLSDANFGVSFEDTGEPVCVYMDYDIESFATSCIIYTTLPGNSHDVAISVYDEAVKKIDKEYMPDDMDSIILKSSTASSTKKFKITVDDSGTISATEVTT